MKKFIFLLLAFGMWVNHGVAQTDSTLASKKSFDLKKADAYKLINPFGNSALGNIISNVSAKSSLKTGESAKLDLSYSKNWLTVGGSVEQTLSKAKQEADFFDLDGFASGTTASINLQGFFWNPDPANTFEIFNNVRNEYAQKKKMDPRVITLDDILENDSAHYFSNQFKAAHFKLNQPFFIGVSASCNKTSFDYITDSVKLTDLNKSYLSQNYKLQLGRPFLFNSGNFGLLVLSYVYSVSYTAGSEQTLLAPFGTTANYVSKTVVVGAPTRTTDNRINLEWRQCLTANLAVSPNVTYGIDSKKINISLPIYFVKSADTATLGKLQGGLRFSYASSVDGDHWTSFKNGFNCELLVTVPFNILSGFD